jgi:hypothetical protein
MHGALLIARTLQIAVQNFNDLPFSAYIHHSWWELGKIYADKLKCTDNIIIMGLPIDYCMQGFIKVGVEA